ncbi:MAG: enoyl-CoA hydratase/isomerase family protein [Candidatus Eremiobacterota bacterium]
MVEIVLDGPGKNALSLEMLESLLERLGRAGGRPVLLTGAGDAFSAGLHLKQLASLDETRMRAFLHLVDRCFTELYQYPGPTVALVNGHAIAGGAVLCQCCDHRVGTEAEGCRIGLNEVALGVRFPPRTLALVRRRLAAQSVDRVLLGAALFDPRQALALGMLDELSPDPAPLARQRLSELSRHPAGVYAATKAALRGATPQDLLSDADHAAGLEDALPAWTSPATRERILAVLRR